MKLALPGIPFLAFLRARRSAIVAGSLALVLLATLHVVVPRRGGGDRRRLRTGLPYHRPAPGRHARGRHPVTGSLIQARPDGAGWGQRPATKNPVGRTAFGGGKRPISNPQPPGAARGGEGAIQRPDHGNRTHAPKNGEEAQSVPINARQSGRPECAERQCARTDQTRRQPGASLRRFQALTAGPAIRGR